VRNLVRKEREGIKPDLDVRPYEQYLLITFAPGTNEQATKGSQQMEAAASIDFLMQALTNIASELGRRNPMALMTALIGLKGRIG
jgi:hypothetical protein